MNHKSTYASRLHYGDHMFALLIYCKFPVSFFYLLQFTANDIKIHNYVFNFSKIFYILWLN